MTARLNPYAATAQVVQPLIDYGQTVAAGLEPSLVALVEIRASQINGCAICLDMHIRGAREAGETEERVYMLNAWRESRLFTPREKAALGWTEALTRLADSHAPDADYEAVMAQFSESEAVTLTMLIGVINSFNKLGVGFRVPPLRKSLKQAAAA
ncbi:carboxymuconolactone decarboxylase family protein [Caulobacter sp. KR2-114]|uniref:carboxymuconolactone decarboxylase family protein n=1 Tax=Caulobacter sp. KR2-114 TaxID=3400912 RepID=UPI003C0D5B71